MKRFLLLSLLVLAAPASAFAQSAEDLKNSGKMTDRVLTYGMGYSHQRFSTLKQIDKQSVRRLAPAWSYSLENNNGEESQAQIGRAHV